ncbi:hypothetical protein B0J13DRAFT_532795 [Dactylonectria estremocensis]|uniref:Uncharacterized protein n=1 Tax=Dactylonectria estremocensis TaxID=1079267 RepID=A0A9P9IEW8_9HYPO|nr:hypothetical protein B0J13DRAFT_532795 [Dactylonectria estremocensis]
MWSRAKGGAERTEMDEDLGKKWTKSASDQFRGLRERQVYIGKLNKTSSIPRLRAQESRLRGLHLSVIDFPHARSRKRLVDGGRGFRVPRNRTESNSPRTFWSLIAMSVKDDEEPWPDKALCPLRLAGEIIEPTAGDDFLDLGEGRWDPKASHNLPERKMAADLICADTSSIGDGTRSQHRLYTTHSLLALGRTTEPRPLRVTVTVTKPIQLPKDCTKEQCFFCFWDEKKRHTDRIRPFCTRYRARDHVHSHHLRGLDDRPIICPHPNCKRAGIELHGTDAMKSHLTRQHDYGIFNTYKGGAQERAMEIRRGTSETVRCAPAALFGMAASRPVGTLMSCYDVKDRIV